MAAITWQNVSGASLADSYKPLLAASSLLNSATTGIADIFKDQNAISKANYEQSKVNNLNTISQAALALQKPDDAEGLAKLTSQISGFGQEIDSVAAAKLLEGRKATLQNNFVNAAAHANAVREDNDRTNSNNTYKAIFAGDFKRAQILAEQLGNPVDELTAIRSAQRQQEADRQTRASQSLSNAAQRLTIDEKRSALAGANVATQHIADFTRQQQLQKEKVQAVLKANGATLDNLGNMDSSKLSKIEAEIQDFAGTPLNAGDSLDVLRQRMALSGLPAAAQEQALKSAGTLLVTGKFVSPEQQKLLLTRQQTVKDQHSAQVKGNIFAAKPSEEEAKDRQILIAAVRTGVKDEGEWTKDGVVNGVNKILEEGIKIDGTTYHPPARLLSSLLPGSLEADEMFFGVNETDSNLKDNLIKFYKDKNNQGAFAAAQSLTPAHLTKKLEETKEVVGNDSPTIDIFNKIIKSREAAQKKEASQSQQPLKK